jgi:hypothetical protein
METKGVDFGPPSAFLTYAIIGIRVSVYFVFRSKDVRKG